MEQRSFGSTGLSVSALGLGGAEIGLEHGEAAGLEYSASQILHTE